MDAGRGGVGGAWGDGPAGGEGTGVVDWGWGGVGVLRGLKEGAGEGSWKLVPMTMT